MFSIAFKVQFSLILHLKAMNAVSFTLTNQFINLIIKMMKKYLLFFGMIVLFSATLLISSCTTDNTTTDLPPTIGFLAESDYLTGDATLTVNTPFSIKVVAQENATSGTNLESMKITRVFNLSSWDTTLTFNESTYTLLSSFIARSTAGVEKIEFKVTDKDGQSATKSLQITTELGTTPINTFAMKILGSYQSATGSSFASIDGSVYTLPEAFANQAKVDFLYWYGASTQATIGAPDDPKANEVYTGVNGLPNWTTKNATRFVETTVTVAEFDAITDGNVLATLAAGATTLSHMGSLAVNTVFAFKTQSGKYGLIKVDAIVTGASGDITIDVKVQQ
jgi:hypothetical protein